jgi:hypothetical protein
MVVIRLGTGELLVHSPAELTPGLREALGSLGEVRFVVPASRLHGHLFMEQYREAYPAADLFAAPGLDVKRRDLTFDGLLGSEPDPRWSADLDQAVFMGSRMALEIVFLHRASRSLIVGDLCAHAGRGVTPAARLVARATAGGGPVFPPPMFRWGLRNKAAARASLERILEWDFERIVVGHGEIVESGGREALRSAYGWLL